MEPQLHHQNANNNDDVQTAGVNSGVQDEGDQQHNEKKSVFRKVKDKAKKLKESITKHGHGGQGDDGDEDDDEIEEDPAVHASSADVPHSISSNDPNSLQKNEPRGLEPEERNGAPLKAIPETRVLDHSGVSKENEEGNQQWVKFGDLDGLEDAQDPRGPSNYQTKSIDHNNGEGGREADVASLVQSFEKTGLHGEKIRPHGDSSGGHGDSARQTDELAQSFGNGDSARQTDELAQSFGHDDSAHQTDELARSFGKMGVHDTQASAGSHDQLAPVSLSNDKTENPTDSIPKASDSIKPDHLQHDTTEPKPADQGSYIGKIASVVPSVITDTAISAKNVVASKLGYGGTKDAETHQIDGTTKPGLAPETREVEGAAKPASYQSVITDKVISAKNVVASKLGYGGTKDAEEQPRTEHISDATKQPSAPETGEVEGSAKPASSTTYVQGMTAKVTETLAPVYSKVADTGSSVISRVRGTGSGGKDEQIVSGDDNKGTPVKGYFYEKFKPGEEEKALSRKITDALHLTKAEEPKTVGTVVDATEEEPRVLAEAKIDGDNNVRAVGPKDVNKGTVDYVKDTVSSWVGKGGQEQQHTQGSSDSQSSGEGPVIDETGHVESVSDDKKMD